MSLVSNLFKNVQTYQSLVTIMFFLFYFFFFFLPISRKSTQNETSLHGPPILVDKTNLV